MNYKVNEPIPASVGIGLRHKHHQDFLNNKNLIPWLEVHSENFFAKGGPAINLLKQIRKNYPISLHGVGLSLGSASKLDKNHLKQLKSLIEIIEPFLLSDHISWSNIDKKTLNDLLPIPYTKESLKIICRNISETQNFLQRQILVENPSAYLSYNNSEMSEDEFINEIAKITGCKILLDVNNIYVSSQNSKAFDPKKYLKNLKQEIVGEMHLAGHSVNDFSGKTILIDTHNDFVCDDVWELYKIAAKKFKVPTLIEWDQDLPSLNELIGEAKKAEKIMKAS